MSNKLENELEVWKSIDGYEDYKISNLGRVMSLKEKNPRIMKSFINKYEYVTLFDGHGNKKNKSVHRLVAQAFIENDLDKPEVNHIDENKMNNTVENLEWVTRLENANHGTRNERVGKGNSKPVVALKNGKVVYEFESMTQAQENGFSLDCISHVVCGRSKTHKGFEWQLVA